MVRTVARGDVGSCGALAPQEAKPRVNVSFVRAKR